MTRPAEAIPPVVFGLAGLDALIQHLRADGYRVLGPTVCDGAIRNGELTGVQDLPVGWSDEQAPGHYRLHRRTDSACFSYAVGPDSPRGIFSPPRVELVSIRRRGASLDVEPHVHVTDAPIAVIGVRGCELAGMATHERVLVGGAFPDPVQSALMRRRFTVAVDCGAPAATCFCGSMGTGPAADQGSDLRLCELIDDAEHRFVCWSGSEAGSAVLRTIPHSVATTADRDAADAVVEHSRGALRTHLKTDALPHRLRAAVTHPRWRAIADRCLSCANCTLVCPTCFCSDVRDTLALDGSAVRVRTWDSCFTVGHSHLASGEVHDTTETRYRQWMLHKLSWWWDQFGESGCVGCGRCSTWCPAAIDFVEEANVIAHGASA